MPNTLSRYRIYGGPRNYLNSLVEIVTGQWNLGASVPALEKRLSKMCGSPNVVTVPLARVGIYLLVKQFLKVRTSSQARGVLMSPYTISDVVNMVIAAGGRPQFVDVDPATGNMCPQSLARRLNADSALILVTHLHGIPAEMEEICFIARAQGLPLIEDNAQSFGSRLRFGNEAAERWLGAIGDAGVLSFGSYKNINSWFGGALLIKDERLAHEIRSDMADWPEFSKWTILRKMRQSLVVDLMGWEPFYSHFIFKIFRHGFLHDIESINRIVAIELDTSRRDALIPWFRSRFTDGQARRVLEQLESFSDFTDSRIAKAAAYDVGIPSGSEIIKPPSPHGNKYVYTYYALQVENRKNLLKWFMHFNRDVAAQHLKNCAALSSFLEFAAECPNADLVARRFLLLPTYPSYREDQVQANVEVLRWYIEQGAPEFSQSAQIDKQVIAALNR